MSFFRSLFQKKPDLPVLDRMEAGVLDDTVPLATLLRQVVVLGGRTASEPLRTWATNELQGYTTPDVELPDYRLLPALIQMDCWAPGQRVTDMTISVLDLPEFARDRVKQEVPMADGVGKIEAVLARAEPGKSVKLSMPGGPELARMMTFERQANGVHVERVYWTVHPSDLHDVLDQVRNRLAQFVSELRATMPAGAPDPTPDQVQQVVQHVITIKTGKHSEVTVNAPVAQAGPNSTATSTIEEPTPEQRD